MNFDEAVQAHTRWKIRLRSCIDGAEKLDHNTVCKDNQCDLGKWIYGEGARFKTLPSFDLVRREHASFHVHAGEIVRQVNAGNKAGAEALVGTGGKFMQSSSSTVMAILRLKKEVP